MAREGRSVGQPESYWHLDLGCDGFGVKTGWLEFPLAHGAHGGLIKEGKAGGLLHFDARGPASSGNGYLQQDDSLLTTSTGGGWVRRFGILAVKWRGANAG